MISLRVFTLRTTVLLLWLVSGCSGSSSASTTKGQGGSSSGSGSFAGSCQNMASGFCNEFTGNMYTAQAVEDNCKTLGTGITYLADRCPSANLVGTCIVYKGASPLDEQFLP